MVIFSISKNKFWFIFISRIVISTNSTTRLESTTEWRRVIGPKLCSRPRPFKAQVWNRLGESFRPMDCKVQNYVLAPIIVLLHFTIQRGLWSTTLLDQGVQMKVGDHWIMEAKPTHAPTKELSVCNNKTWYWASALDVLKNSDFNNLKITLSILT